MALFITLAAAYAYSQFHWGWGPSGNDQSIEDPLGTSDAMPQQAHHIGHISELGPSTYRTALAWPGAQSDLANTMSDNPAVNSLFASKEYQQKFNEQQMMGEHEYSMWADGCFQLNPDQMYIRTPTQPVRVPFRITR